MKHFGVAGLALFLSGCIDPLPRDREMGHDEEISTKVLVVHRKPAPTPAALAEACKISLADAIATALTQVKGKALGAGVEIEDGKALIEVEILLDGKLWEVEIDAATGDVIEVEQEDDDDEDDDGDDDELKR